MAKPPNGFKGPLGLLRVQGSALAFLMFLSACGAEPVPQVFAPLGYDYLTPLRLNVGTIDIDAHWQPTSRADVSALSPVRPKDALVTMAQDRLKVGGSTGRAVFTIDDAALLKSGDTVQGSLAVHLTIYGEGAAAVGSTEARVSRTRSGLGRDAALPGVLYDLTRQMMDAMNVELEYQVRRSLKDWLVAASASAPVAVPVEQQPLSPP